MGGGGGLSKGTDVVVKGEVCPSVRNRGWKGIHQGIRPIQVGGGLPGTQKAQTALDLERVGRKFRSSEHH